MLSADDGLRPKNMSFPLILVGSGIMFFLLAANFAYGQQYQWTQIDSDTSPLARRSQAMTYDPEQKLIVLFGGYGNGSHLNDTWIYNPQTETWNGVSSPLSPSPRAATTLVYEPQSKQLILFGGFASGHAIVYNDTWAYDTSKGSWADLKSKDPPSARASYGMTFDSKRNTIVLFGGFTEHGYFNDVWIYDPVKNLWREQKITGDAPSPRGAMGFAYDEGNDVFVMFGGFSDAGFFGDTWILDLNNNTWTEMDPDTSPPPARTRLVYHDGIGKPVFFGGDIIRVENVEPAVEPYDKVWSYDYTANNWQEIVVASSAGSTPAKRSLNGIAYDSHSQSLLIFGGTDALIDAQNFAGREFQDTWALELQDPGATAGETETSFQSFSPFLVPVLVGITAVGVGIGLFFWKARSRITAPR
jgi:N-acetylneuraminic acid mutarotase